MDNFLKYKQIYSANQVNVIAQEFSRLKENCYLDHAGATLYSEKQIQNVFLDLSNNIYANPHARNLSSKSTEDAIDIIRFQILEHFNTNSEEYAVIFTSGATAALKIIAECFNYGENNKGTFAYLEDNHTSVLGMRNFVESVVEIKTSAAFKILSCNNSCTSQGNEESNSLFVYPAQSNFSGTKYPLTWINSVKQGILNHLTDVKSKYWYVVLDCSSYVSTNVLDLSTYQPDFVPFSFYKMFGYPTGLGALLVKKCNEELLNKRYLGGGTVLMALSSKNIMVARTNIHERFEDGTLPFLSILAIKHGYDTIKRLNLHLEIISQHTFSLAQYVYRNLLTLHHFNKKPVVILYHDTTFESREHQGGLINFNLLRPNGDFIGYSEVLHISNLHGIHLRTGCFCNPGACQLFLRLTANDVLRHFKAGHVCGDQYDLVDNYPTGSVRISFGYMSTKEDADKFLQMVETCFVSKPIIRKLPSNWDDLQLNYKEKFCGNDNKKNIFKKIQENNNYKVSNPVNEYLDKECNVDKIKADDLIGTLQQILLYPIKSCSPFSVQNSWSLTSTGLKYDRQWMIVNPSGVCLTQKQNKKLCLIRPDVNLEKNTLRLQFNGHPDAEISLNAPSNVEKAAFLCQSKVCGDRIQGWDCGDQVADWLSICLEIPGLRLLRQCDSNEEVLGRISRKDTTPQLSLANKAQYLLINAASADWLIKRIPNGELNEDNNSVILRFRPNFIVDFKQPFQENEFDDFLFENILFKSAGKCTRCQMICINQKTGEISKEPLLTLSREFKGKISFGIYLNQEVTEDEAVVSIGNSIVGRHRSS